MDELFHYRTPGSVNGRRLYQNKDGSLTYLGRLRYLKDEKNKSLYYDPSYKPGGFDFYGKSSQNDLNAYKNRIGTKSYKGYERAEMESAYIKPKKILKKKPLSIDFGKIVDNVYNYYKDNGKEIAKNIIKNETKNIIKSKLKTDMLIDTIGNTPVKLLVVNKNENQSIIEKGKTYLSNDNFWHNFNNMQVSPLLFIIEKISDIIRK